MVDLGVTFGFLKDKNGIVAVANRIFETQFYDMFLAEMAVNNKLYMETASNRNQFIVSGMLQMDLVMKKFYEYYEEIFSLTIKESSLLLSLKFGVETNTICEGKSSCLNIWNTISRTEDIC